MRFLLAGLLVAALSVPIFAQTAAIQAPPLPDAPDKPVIGLALTFSAGGKTDTRPARLVALHVPAGQPVSPFLAAGPFTATWTGEINRPLRSDYVFSADVSGSFKLTVNDKVVLETAGEATAEKLNKKVRLNKGANRIVAEFASDGKQDATVRLLWSSKEFPNEPVPPATMSHAVSPDELSGNRIREGRFLFAEFRCAACHADPSLPARGTGMPELAQDAPVFDDLGAKYNETWLAHWINDPHSIRPRSIMPKVFHAPEGKVDQKAADLAAYFVSLGKAEEAKVNPDNGPLGGVLFANLGCIACHSTPDAQGKDENNRVPLAHLKAKWKPVALREYLKAPEKNYLWTHMPNFGLSDQEAEQLTAYLLSGKQREFAAGSAGDAARGAQLLVTANCLNCHAGMPPMQTPALAQTLQSGWTKGCMAPDPTARGNAPDFAFTAAQREALQAFAAHGFDSLKQDVPLEFAERQLANNNCVACHARDQTPSLWFALEEEMRALQQAVPAAVTHEEGKPAAGTTAPILTWTGEKLQPEWMAKFIAGHIGYKPRPWIIARMPAFKAAAEGIAAGLSMEHGFSPVLTLEPAPEPERAKIGGILLGESGGFNCTTCHGLGERAPTAVFEAPGINLAYTPERLRKGYYHRWVLHPLRIDPDTKMPRFSDDDGKTPLTDHYEGVASDQFEGIWQHLRTIPKAPAHGFKH
ncbi:MAG TPA: c-type cytochrome [Chthoniobacteraceae bacterium]|jgi:cytochrome c1